MSAILIALVTAAMFYLGSRATITSWLWSRYPPRFARFMDCPACTGFWWGMILASTVGYAEHLSYLGLDLGNPANAWLVGLASIVTTPIVAGLMYRGLDATGTAVEPAPPAEKHDWQELP